MWRIGRFVKKLLGIKKVGFVAASPAIAVNIGPLQVFLYERSDAYNPSTGETYTFKNSSGSPHNSAQAASNGAYICDFTHEATVYRLGDFVVIELEARVNVGPDSMAKKIWTFKRGKTMYAPFFSVSIIAQGSPIGPISNDPAHGNGDRGMFPMYLEFEKIERGNNALSKRSIFRVKSPIPISTIGPIEILNPTRNSIAVSTK